MHLYHKKAKKYEEKYKNLTLMIGGQYFDLLPEIKEPDQYIEFHKIKVLISTIFEKSEEHPFFIWKQTHLPIIDMNFDVIHLGILSGEDYRHITILINEKNMTDIKIVTAKTTKQNTNLRAPKHVFLVKTKQIIENNNNQMSKLHLLSYFCEYNGDIKINEHQFKGYDSDKYYTEVIRNIIKESKTNIFENEHEQHHLFIWDRYIKDIIIGKIYNVSKDIVDSYKFPISIEKYINCIIESNAHLLQPHEFRDKIINARSNLSQMITLKISQFVENEEKIYEKFNTIGLKLPKELPVRLSGLKKPHLTVGKKIHFDLVHRNFQVFLINKLLLGEIQSFGNPKDEWKNLCDQYFPCLNHLKLLREKIFGDAIKFNKKYNVLEENITNSIIELFLNIMNNYGANVPNYSSIPLCVDEVCFVVKGDDEIDRLRQIYKRIKENGFIFWFHDDVKMLN